jgi:uncharacterized protein YbjT (DUF2867 family)
MNNILVLGGSGFVGSSVCEKLVERSNGAGGRITVPTRWLTRSRHVQMLPTVEVREANLHDDAQLARLVAGRDAVINLVAILHGSEQQLQQVNVALNERLARACAAAKVKRVIHVSALGADASAPSKYLRSKAGGEAAWRSSGLAVTVLRPSVIFGEHDRFINLFAKLHGLFPFIPLASADAKFQPVWVDDVATAVVRALDRRRPDGELASEVIECAGPQIFTLRQLVHCAGVWSGDARPIVALPAALGRLQAAMMELLPGEPLISRDNLDSMKVPSVAHPGRTDLAALGILPSSLEGVMAPWLEGLGGPARLEAWRRPAGR